MSAFVAVQGCTCANQLLNLLPMVGASSAQMIFGEMIPYPALTSHACTTAFAMLAWQAR